jgi:alkylation response protein AidB-like acyl-CoA dehydrogenase
MTETGLTPEHLAFRDTVRRFARERVHPGAADRDRSQEHPRDLVGQLGQLGALGITTAAEYGGLGLDLLTQAIALEELAYADAALGSIIAGHYLGVEAIVQAGDDSQKQEHLPALSTGARRIAFALTEPDAGSDIASMRSRARPDDAGGWHLDGTKTFISNADEADIIIVFARTEPGPGMAGISAFIVPADAPGLERSRPIEKMGLRSEHAYELSFRDVVLPPAALLGPAGTGGKLALTVLNSARIDTAAVATGVAARGLDLAWQYAQQRRQFGQAIAQFQAIQLMLGRMDALTEAARRITYDAARAAAEGTSGRRLGAIAKYIASEHCAQVVDMALQVHGGYGYVVESEIERLYRDARVFRIYEGTSDIQLLAIFRSLSSRR